MMHRELNECMLLTDCLKPYEKTCSPEKYGNAFAKCWFRPRCLCFMFVSSRILLPSVNLGSQWNLITFKKCTLIINLWKNKFFLGLMAACLCPPTFLFGILSIETLYNLNLHTEQYLHYGRCYRKSNLDGYIHGTALELYHYIFILANSTQKRFFLAWLPTSSYVYLNAVTRLVSSNLCLYHK